MKRILTLLLSTTLTLSQAVPALAVQSEQETAAWGFLPVPSAMTFPPVICWAGIAARLIFGVAALTVMLASTFPGTLSFPV